MPTKRKRIRRKKTLKGGIPFVPGTKTAEENISNCEKYWSHGFGKDPARCKTWDNKTKKYKETSTYTEIIDYPGKARQLLGYEPTTKPTGEEKRYVQRTKYDW